MPGTPPDAQCKTCGTDMFYVPLVGYVSEYGCVATRRSLTTTRTWSLRACTSCDSLAQCRCSSMAECDLPKVDTRVRFPSSARTMHDVHGVA